jgi:hypothetical protein
VHEVARCGKLIGWWAAKAREIQATYAPEAFACDPAEPAYISEFNAAGVNAVGAYNDIERGIQAVQARMKVPADGRPRLLLLADALEERDETLVNRKAPVGLAEEIEGYVWAQAKEGKPLKEEPADLNNHSDDAMRYAIAYIDGLGVAAEWGADALRGFNGHARRASSLGTPQRQGRGLFAGRQE